MHFQSSLIVLCSLASVAFAAMGQGAFNYTRDYVIWYNPSVYNNTETFCRTLHDACVNVAGPCNEHHQLDCVFAEQKGPRIHAFCGGIAKTSTGSWTKGGTVFDHIGIAHLRSSEPYFAQQTPAAIKNLNATIIQEPMGKEACLKFRKKHSTVVC
ncbi:BQ2448_6288 [Microbotryum intermedium]|uniref:BQ2448_6288 protein n=1 Tax=Microbotryum intermedium TaxID=269621 RepID=A0A238FRL1_9BASI|nr:BQ2448_6288 [Microbotryum intermedium]